MLGASLSEEELAPKKSQSVIYFENGFKKIGLIVLKGGEERNRRRQVSNCLYQVCSVQLQSSSTSWSRLFRGKALKQPIG